MNDKRKILLGLLTISMIVGAFLFGTIWSEADAKFYKTNYPLGIDKYQDIADSHDILSVKNIATGELKPYMPYFNLVNYQDLRNFLGFELNKEYCKIAEQRILNETTVIGN